MDQIQNSLDARRDRLRLAGHTLVGVAVALEGISRIGVPKENWPFILFCLLAAVVIVLSVIYHARLTPIARDPHAIPYVLEAVLAFSLGFMGLSEGKLYLPYVWLLAGVLAVVAAVVIIVHAANRSRVQIAPVEDRTAALPETPVAVAPAERAKSKPAPRKKTGQKKRITRKKSKSKPKPVRRKKKPAPKRRKR